MKVLKVIFIVLVSIVALLVVIGFFLPSKVHIEISKTMTSPPASVYNQINDLKDWNGWMPFNKMDTSMKQTWGDKTSGEGASYSWASKKVGNGSVTITKAMINLDVETALDFKEMGTATSGFKLDKADAGTKVTWTMDQEIGNNPFNRLKGALMSKVMGTIFENGLKDLDSCATANPVNPMPVESSPVAVQDSTGKH